MGVSGCQLGRLTEASGDGKGGGWRAADQAGAPFDEDVAIAESGEGL